LRMKTGEKRASIIDAAEAVFLERGYDTASMAEVSAKLGGSKQTLYSYFKSKSELFIAVMLERGAAQVLGIFDAMHDNPDLESSLRTFGGALLRFLMRDEVLAVRRLIMAEGAKSDLGLIFFENGPKQGLTRLASDFARRMDRGEMRRADPWRAAVHLLGLLEAGPFQWRLSGAIDTVDESEIDRIVEDAIDVFLRAYRP
jgi:AcrR family transcriptional regulator